MTAAESVFAADSTAALAHLRCLADSGAQPQALATASFLDFATSFSHNATAAMRWLIDHIATRSAPHARRPVHQEAMRLADPSDDFAAMRALPGGAKLTQAWAVRREALHQYHAALVTGGAREPESVLPSLMHLNYLRVAGVDSHGEDICSRLVRSAALAWTARTQGATA